MGRALEYSRRAAKRADSSSVRAVAKVRQFVCEALRILRAPYGPLGRGLAPPVIRPDGMANAFGIMCTLSRMVKDAARGDPISVGIRCALRPADEV